MPSRDERPLPPRFMRLARDLYGPAFEVAAPGEISESAADWSRLNEAQRSFALAHLLYLNLQAQAGILRQLGGLQSAVDDAADDVAELRDHARSRERRNDGQIEIVGVSGGDGTAMPLPEEDHTEPLAEAGDLDQDADPADPPDTGGLSPLAALFSSPNAEEVTDADR